MRFILNEWIFNAVYQSIRILHHRNLNIYLIYIK